MHTVLVMRLALALVLVTSGTGAARAENWSLPSDRNAAVLVHLSMPAVYEVCRDDVVRANVQESGSVTGLVLDGVPLMGSLSWGSEEKPETRMAFLPLQPKSCAMVRARSIAVFRTDHTEATPPNTIFGKFTRQSPLNPTDQGRSWRVNVQDTTQMRPYSAGLLYHLPSAKVAVICRTPLQNEPAWTQEGISARVGLMLDGRLLEISVPFSGEKGAPVSPFENMLRATHLLHESSCAHVEASSVSVVVLGTSGPNSLQVTASGTFTVQDPPMVSPR
jgi:hypothetical protein